MLVCYWVFRHANEINFLQHNFVLWVLQKIISTDDRNDQPGHVTGIPRCFTPRIACSMLILNPFILYSHTCFIHFLHYALTSSLMPAFIRNNEEKTKYMLVFMKKEINEETTLNTNEFHQIKQKWMPLCQSSEHTVFW